MPVMFSTENPAGQRCEEAGVARMAVSSWAQTSAMLCTRANSFLATMPRISARSSPEICSCTSGRNTSSTLRTRSAVSTVVSARKGL